MNQILQWQSKPTITLSGLILSVVYIICFLCFVFISEPVKDGNVPIGKDSQTSPIEIEPWWIGVIAALIVLIIVFLIVLCCTYRKSKKAHSPLYDEKQKLKEQFGDT